ncbi:MAG: hypothetical protein DMG24_06250 [Acidobacteria bacterium]|nr:MAG: hypothetical protein DMG24_06250 [Acidobacteriota bacterium]
MELSTSKRLQEFGGWMKQAKVHKLSLALVVLFSLVGLFETTNYAQQATPTPRANGAASSASDRDPKTASVPKDKVVIKVGSQQVTAADFDFLFQTLNAQDQKTLATQGKQPLADQYILTLVLEQQALRDHLDATADFRRQEELGRAQRLAQAEYEKMAHDIQVNPQETKQYYDAHASDFDELAVRQVGIRKKGGGAQGDAAGLSPQDAKARAEEIRKALAAGTDPKKVAQDFAIPNVVLVDTQERNIQRGQLPADLDAAFFKLKDGDLSEPVETPQSIAFVQVVRHVHPELKDASSQVETAIRQQKLQAKIAELKHQTPIWADQSFFTAPSVEKPATGTPAVRVPTAQPPASPSSKPPQAEHSPNN